METDIALKDIRVLTNLYKEKSLKECARVLGKTPSTISKTLAKLRDAYDDPLFVTSQSGAEPTPRLLAIIEDLFAVQATLEKSLDTQQQFDAHSFIGDLTVSCSLGIIERFGAELFQEIKRLAPQAKIDLQTWTRDTQEQLALGKVTAALHFLSEEKPQHIYQKCLFDDQMVLACRKDHPAINLMQALDYPALILKASGWNDRRYHFLETLKTHQLHYQHGGFVDHLSLGLKLVQNTNNVMFVPSRALDKQYKYFRFDDIFYLPLKVVYCVKTANRSSALHNWLYDVCLSVIKDEMA
ncbi:LysR family transcriptional regulator [Psychromonas ossibalaenae]|uniref:LysR family transcriptional regulator n=1 Tax=Psychromonas ossibalaenae TaxID=444922 RepID=UPI000368DAC4|nr:LysR family transcriptional regulator [Psychromonas ossibalaenae]